jgi:sugar lactone lactonase YvrE
MGDRHQRLLWLDIPNGRVHRFAPATGSDDVFGVGKPVGAVGLHAGKIKVSGKSLAGGVLVTRGFAAGWAAQSDSHLGNRSWVSTARSAHRLS